MINNCFGFLITSYFVISNFQIAITCPPVKQRSSTFCDDGKTYLGVDWDNSSTFEYTCTKPEGYILNPKIKSKTYYDPGVKSFKAQHFCMDTKIKYKKVFQTIGDSRPVWAHYGEYKYIPPQRGFHNLENGAIVALHHPCADKKEVQKLNSLVKSCLRRYIIAPYKGLTKKRPLAVLSWGWSLKMNFVEKKKVIKFIRDHAIKHAPQNIAEDGKYDYELLEKPAQKDTSDKKLCPTNK